MNGLRLTFALFSPLNDSSSNQFNRNWDWNIKNANYGQFWLVLYCGDAYQGCTQAHEEWEKAFHLIGAYCRMGRINVDAQWSLTRNFNIRYVPSVYSIVNGEMTYYQGPLTADSLYSFVKMSISHPFANLGSVQDWENAFNWQSRLKGDGFDTPEKVTVVLYTSEKTVPLKWRYWSHKFSDSIRWYLLHPSFSSKQLLSHVSALYGVNQPGVAMLFPNPRDNNEVVMLADPDTRGESVELTSSEIEEWLSVNQYPTVAKIDPSNFLKIVGSGHYTIAMAVDMKVGSSSSSATLAGNSRLRRLLKLIEPLTTLWEQRKGPSLKELQFVWFGTHRANIAKCFGINTEPKDGQLFLLDRRRWEYAVLPLDIDRDDVSTFVNHIVKYSQKQLHMTKMRHIPQSTDDQWSFSAAMESASNFTFVFMGIAIVALGSFILIKSSSSSQTTTKQQSSQKKPNPSTPSSSSSSSSATNKESPSSTASSTKEKPQEQSQKATSSSSNSSQTFSTIIDEPFWDEFKRNTYQDILERKNFTLVLFPRLDNAKEVRQWTREVGKAFLDLSTDSITLAWAHSGTYTRYVKEWIRIGNEQLASIEDSNAGNGTTMGILLRKRGARFMVFSGDAQSRMLDANVLVAWVQRVLEGQTSWIDIPNDAPSL